MRYEVNIYPFIESEIEKTPDGQPKVAVGRLDDMVGWRWFWGGEFPQSFFIRIMKSDLWPEYIKEWQTKGLTFEDFKKILLGFENDSQKDSLLYVLSGDNAMWHFGLQFQIENENLELDFKAELQEKGFTKEQIEEIMDKFWTVFSPNCTTWKNISSQDKENWLGWYKDAVKEAKDWESLRESLLEIGDEIQTEVLSLYRQEAQEQFEKIVKEFSKGQPAH